MTILGGVEAIHKWTPPEAGAVAIEVGRVYSDVGKVVWPHYKLKTITGLHSLGTGENNQDPRPGAIGTSPRLSQAREKMVTYEGWIRARTIVSLREAEAKLRSAFNKRSTEGRMDVIWHPLNTTFAAQVPKFYEARSLGVEIVDNQDSNRFQRRFVIALCMSDPRYFEDKVVAEAVVANTNTSVDFA